MPTYEYRCFSCNHHFEAFQKISDEPVKVCPKCSANSGSVKRLLSAAPFHLKGSGWYKTDYAASAARGNPKVKESADSKTGSSAADSERSSSPDTKESTNNTPEAKDD